MKDKKERSGAFSFSSLIKLVPLVWKSNVAIALIPIRLATTCYLLLKQLNNGAPDGAHI